MKYCKSCGKPIDDNAVICVNCGTLVEDKNLKVKDSGSVGWGILGFLIPIVGLILFSTWKNERPKSAKASGIGALIGFILGILGSFIMTIIQF